MSEEKFARGTSLSIFVSDRREDIGALIGAARLSVCVDSVSTCS